MELRIARHTGAPGRGRRFLPRGLGLTEIGGSRDHDGHGGVFLEVPGTGAHLELTAGGGTELPPRIRSRFSCCTSATTPR